MKIKAVEGRIAALDGLRGIAILCVVLFHFYSPDAKTYLAAPTYSAGLQESLPVKYGYYGVMLFFAISGFVISQTLRGAKSLADFGVRRFARLWPSMFLCSVITYGFSFVLPVVTVQTVRDFVPSLTFLDPAIFNWLFRSHTFNWMDGTYWTLFVEVRFYALIACLYFARREFFFRNFLIISTAIGLLFPLSIYFGVAPLRSGLSFFLIASDLPWFSFGVGCFYLNAGENKKALWLMLGSVMSIALYALATTLRPFKAFSGIEFLLAAALIFALMVASIKVRAVKALVSNSVLSTIGLVSYSLYLLHNHIGEKLILLVGNPLQLTPPYAAVYPLFVLALLIAISAAIYAYWESPANRWINRLYRNRSGKSPVVVVV